MLKILTLFNIFHKDSSNDQLAKYQSQIEELTNLKQKYSSELELLRVEVVKHQNENVQLKSQNEKTQIDLSSLNEKLDSSSIDLKQTKEKLAENLKDYKNSIENVKQKFAQKISRLKKKLSNSVTVLNLIEKNIFHLDQGEQSIFSEFLNSLADKKAQTDLDESNVAYEMDEAKFTEIIQKKSFDLQKLSNYAKLEQDLNSLNDSFAIQKAELDACKHNLNLAESKLKDQKEIVNLEYQKNIDELQLKLANLDLKNKQLLNEDNRESHAVKKKLIKLEEDYEKVKKENESLIIKHQQDGESNEKNLNSIKQKAELRMASIKVR
jgi:hypothetical protein